MRGTTKQILGLGLVMAAAAGVQARTQSVPVWVNGNRIQGKAVLLPEVGRTVLPMRDLFESLGAQVEWDPTEKAVYAWTPDRIGVRLALGEGFAQRLRVNRDPRPGRWGRVIGTQHLEAPAMLIAGRVFVPLRFASESLNAGVRYNAAEPAIRITTQRVAGTRQEIDPDVEPEIEEPVPPRVRDRVRDRVGTTRQPDAADPEFLAANVGFTVELGNRRVTRNDREVSVLLTIQNQSNRSLTIPFRSSQEFDVEILQEGRLVWSWAAGRVFSQALKSLTLEPGEQETYRVRWDLRDNDGKVVPPGRYMVRGILTTEFRRPQIVAEDRLTVE